MSLSRFSVIVAIDANAGISKKGILPWQSRSDMSFFREMTVGKGNNKNVIIMGRKTYESLPEESKPLKDRVNIVISKRWDQGEYPDITIYKTLLDCLNGIGQKHVVYDDVFIIGGEILYKETVDDYMHLCDRVYVTKFKTNYECDKFFPFDKVKHFPQVKAATNTVDYTRYFFKPDVIHPEYLYLDLLRELKEHGEPRKDRTGTGTLSKFGHMITIDISTKFPLMTTKELKFEMIAKEMLWMVSGSTNCKALEELGVNVWKDNTSREFLDAKGLTNLGDGDMGPGYGHQWRYWGAEYVDMWTDYEGKGFDQLSTLIKQIKKDPTSRRHILNAWNAGEIDKMALPPCHMMCQFYVSNDNNHLDCQLYLRSSDTFLGLPWNIAGYALLIYMIAYLCKLKPRKLNIVFGDAHLYKNHIESVEKQLKRTPRSLPTLTIKADGPIKHIDDFKLEHFILTGYSPCPYLAGKMSI